MKIKKELNDDDPQCCFLNVVLKKWDLLSVLSKLIKFKYWHLFRGGLGLLCSLIARQRIKRTGVSSGNSSCWILVLMLAIICAEQRRTVMGGEFSWQCFVASVGGGGVDIWIICSKVPFEVRGRQSAVQIFNNGKAVAANRQYFPLKWLIKIFHDNAQLFYWPSWCATSFLTSCIWYKMSNPCEVVGDYRNNCDDNPRWLVDD